jgi:Ca2+-binding EF-hand superfamily protein
MFSPIGKKKLIVELKRVPLNQREEYLKTHLKDSLQKKTNSSPSRSPSPKKDKAHSSSPPRVRTPLVQTIAAGSSATRNLDYILQEETLLGEVTRKIADVAVRYRRERDAVLLTVFNSNALSYQEFRDHLNRSFRLKFTDEEFTEVIKLFDNDGDGGIDGSEFLVCFTKLGLSSPLLHFLFDLFFCLVPLSIASIVKAKEAAAVREKQFQYEQMMKQKEEEKKYNLERKHELLVDYEFSEETRERALAKMTDAAKKYDKNHPAAVSLDGFDGQFLLPAEFKEILKRTFGLKLSPTELGALIKEFDQNGDGHVECSEFLITFFKLGFAARERDLVEQREKQQRMTAEMEEKKKNKMKELEEKVELAVDYDFSEADEARMHAKLKEAAKKYDRYHPASVGLEGFDVQFMKPGVFREMVKRTFHLTLTGKELGAAVKTFDKIGDGTIPCRDFLMHFHQIGYTEKNHERLLQIQKQRELDRIAEEERVRKLKAIEEKVTVPIAETCERSDLEKAFEKLRVAALKYDRSHPSAVSLDGFEGSYLTPGVFRELLKRTFNIKLTPTELKAMVTEFSISSPGVSGGTGGGSGGAGVGAGGEVSRGSGEVSAEISGDEPHEKVSCAEFLKQFFKLSFEEKSKIHHEMLQKQREAEKAAEAEEDRKRRETEERMSLEVDYDFQEKDEKTALEKITKAAIKYDKNHPSAPCLDGFGGAFMTPYVFKDMLFRAFHIKLSPKELGATMKHFDKDLSGTVDCSEFLNSFFRLGFQKRSEMHHKQLEKQKEANYQRTRSELLKLCEQEKKMNMKLDWEFTDDDLKNVNEKITEAAMKYDKNHPASVSLDGFESQKLAPGIFREMIRRTFNIQLNPRELAAMLTVFESDKDGNIDTRNFVTKFMRIGLEKREEFKLEMLQKQRNLMKKHKLEREEKIANQWKKMEAMVDIDFQFGPEDEERAMRKLVKAAMKYEKNAVSSPSLEGFSCVYLQPGAFKEMLKRTFNLHVNGKQLGSLVKRFEHPDHVNSVDCSMFVINFLALGHQERRKQKAIKDELQRKFLKSTSGATGELQLGASSSSTTAGEGAGEGGGKETREFSEMERKRMLSKLTEAAFKFDKQMPGAMSLDGFDALFLTPSEFKDLIKRTFNLRLDSSEFNALLVRYDPEHSQRIVSKDFLTDFLQIGIREREKLKIKNLEKNRLGLKLQRQEELRKLNEVKKKIMKEIPLEFTAEEQRVAFEKLSQGAMRYDKTHPSAVGLEGFEVNSLHYGEFRELLKQTFHIILSDGELAAVVHHFDPKKEKRIASKDFLIYFFKLGFNERQKFHQEVLRRDREVTRQRERETQEKLELRWAQKEMKIDWEFSEKDLESGVEKLREAAREYDPQHPSAMSLSAFDALTMSPAVFREMLKRIMNISLTDKELSALVTHFDREGDHTVTCADFLVKFLTLGTQERNKITQQNRLKIIQKTKKVKQEEDLKEKLKTEKMEACVNYDFTHEQFASTMEKLKLAASTYDRNHPSAVSLDGFQGSSLSPGVFREMLKRTFNIKLDPGELGAAVKFFDSDGDGTIDTAEFLKHFFKLQRTERSAVRRQRIQAEREVKKKLEDEVKERYVSQLHFSSPSLHSSLHLTSHRGCGCCVGFVKRLWKMRQR